MIKVDGKQVEYMELEKNLRKDAEVSISVKNSKQTGFKWSIFGVEMDSEEVPQSG